MNQTTPRTSLSTRIALRLAVGVVAFMTLGGPSPGYIGGCSRTVVPPNLGQYCTDRRVYECVRDFDAGRITLEERLACPEEARANCVRNTWMEPCIPTQAVLNRCIAALQDGTRNATLNADIVECQRDSICPGSATGALTTVDPHGI